MKAFISYRRRDTFMKVDGGGDPDFTFIDELAGALEQAGFDDVFIDKSDIKVGEAYDTKINKEISECDLFVAVIGRKWLEILHQKRDAGERDVLVREIWSARLKEKPIVPLLVDGAEMPRPIDLPPRIRRFHYQNGVGIKSDDTRQSIAAVLNGASDELKRIHKLLSSWRGAYIAFACVAYFCCAILPHIVGAWEFGSSWVGMAKVWSGFYFWPICFLPFILVALYRPLTTLVESAIIAPAWKDKLVYLRPLAFGTLIAVLATVLEVAGPFEVPWSIHPALPDCPPASSVAPPNFSILRTYDNPQGAGPLQARYGNEFWMTNKCWPNVFYYLTVPVYQNAANAAYLAERPDVQRKFKSLLESGAGWSTSVPPYIVSFFILAWLGCTGIVMSVFYVMVQITKPNDDDVLRLPAEDAYLCLTFSFVTLMAWLPFRMITIYFKKLYSCEVIDSCVTNPLIYLNDGVLCAMLLIAYVFLTAGLLVKYKRQALAFLGSAAVAVILLGAFAVARFGNQIAIFADHWQFYVGISIPSILIMMALWYLFDPSMVHIGDFNSEKDKDKDADSGSSD